MRYLAISLLVLAGCVSSGNLDPVPMKRWVHPTIATLPDQSLPGTIP